MNHWITVIYNEERAQEASFYQRAFQERGYRWITDTAKDTLLLSDAAVFIWSDGLRADPHAQELLTLCRERKIPVLFVHYELSGLPADDQIMDAGKTSFEDFERALEETRSYPKEKRDREYFRGCSCIHRCRISDRFPVKTFAARVIRSVRGTGQ